jgi:hypothetical protein
MPLNVEFLDHDMYDVELMYRCLFPKEFQEEKEQKDYNTILQSVMRKHTPVTSMHNKFLESIISSSDATNKNEIELIARPYLHNGKKTIIDQCCEFQQPSNGDFLIELVPKYAIVRPNKLPEGVYSIRHNHTHCIFIYTLPKRYEYDTEMKTVTIYLSYNPDKTLSVDKPEPVNTVKSGDIAA